MLRHEVDNHLTPEFKITPAQDKARDMPTVLQELGIAFNKNKTAFREKAPLIFSRGEYGVFQPARCDDESAGA